MTYTIGVTDLETTGLDQSKGHRIIEVGLAVFRSEDGYSFSQVGSTYNKRLDPQRSIDEKAQKVHGISLESLRGCDTWESYSPRLGKTFQMLDLVVVHNEDFDIPFLVGEFMRAKVDFGDPDVFCTMKNGRAATPLGSTPSLEALCWAMGVSYDRTRAHSAGYDVDCTSQCLFRGIEMGVFQIESLEAYRKRAA